MSKVEGVVEKDSGFTERENVSESRDARHSTRSRSCCDLGWGGGGHSDLPKTEATCGVGIYFGWCGTWAEHTTLSSDFERGGDSDVGRAGGDSSNVFGWPAF